VTDSEIQILITSTTKESIKEYVDALKSKVDSLDAKSERITLILLLIGITYFLIKDSLIAQVNLGIVELSKVDIGLIAIPPVFTFLLFYYTVLNTHKSRSLNSCKVLIHYYYFGEVKSLRDVAKEESFVHLFIPFSVFGEISNITKNKVGCFSGLLHLPLFGLIFMPFWFLYHSLSYLYFEYWDKSTFAKPALFLSVWLVLVTITFFIKLITPGIREVIEERNLENQNSK
jgi:hypothetical protein